MPQVSLRNPDRKRRRGWEGRLTEKGTLELDFKQGESLIDGHKGKEESGATDDEKGTLKGTPGQITLTCLTLTLNLQTHTQESQTVLKHITCPDAGFPSQALFYQQVPRMKAVDVSMAVPLSLDVL